MKAFLLITGILLSLTIIAQPTIQWQKVYGGSFSDYETVSADTTMDGGYIIAGLYAYSYNPNYSYYINEYTDGFLMRLDAAHNVVWKKSYNGMRNDGTDTTNLYDAFFSVKHTADGGFIAAGSTATGQTGYNTVGTDNTILIVKTDANGDTLWQRDIVFGAPPIGFGAQSRGASVIQTLDGGYVVAGWAAGFENAYVVKLDAGGNTVWQQTYSGTQYNRANCIKQTPDGGYIIAGLDFSISNSSPTNNGRTDYWVLKTDALGNVQWQKNYGGSLNEGATSIDLTNDGGYIVGGYSQSNDGDVTGNHGSYDYWIVKISSTGTLQWQKSLGGSQYDEADAISTTPDNSYLVTGYSSSSDGDVVGHHSGAVVHADAWTVKLDNTGNIIWQNSVGSVNSEGGRSIIPTANGCVFAGTNNSKKYISSNTYLSGDYWLVSLDANGNIASQVTAGASGGANYAGSVVQATDGGYVTAGYGNSANHDVTGNHGGFDGWVVKTDNVGAIQWTASLGGSDDDYIRSINKTSDGGYIAAGCSYSSDGEVTLNKGNSDLWIVKLSSTGSLQWQKTYGGSSYDSAASVQQTADGGYIVAGKTYSTNGDVSANHGSADVWVIKLDASGNLVWQKTYGGTGTDVATSIEQTTDGGYIVAAYSNSVDGDVTGNLGYNVFWILKLDATGTLTWQKSYGDTFNAYAYSIIQTNDGGYITAGYAQSPANSNVNDFLVIRLDGSGNAIWRQKYGGSGEDFAKSVIQTSDGNFVIGGSSNSTDSTVTGNHGYDDYWLIKINAAGNLIWEKSLGGSSVDLLYSVKQTSDSGLIVAGSATSHDGDVTNNVGVYNYWVVKLAADILPVTLLNFDGLIKDNNALLSWQTASEINNKGFDIQKSNDGQNFNTIGFVTGAGTSSLINNYNYTDSKVVNGFNYYRLKQVDIDNKFVYSPVIKLDYSNFGWHILGNPFSKNITVELQMDKQANVTLQLLSLNGNIITNINKGKINAGTYSIPMDISDKAAGTYIVRLMVNDKQYAQKVVKY